ncbi:hypothetical protein HNP98_003140 [Hymenobacter sp. 9A]|uniref:DUF2064 domain-containing protein n=1 Tax=Hymenobacter caeli TaxID=2735894 RepID=A0ABX2FV59_9BACT|nr:DUF2064 domain-containing protein [Hymenobacter caeli]NRT20300.1 hypothetical protein [Hymenobacter caeli]
MPTSLPTSTVALLLFTRSAGQEATHKRFRSHGLRTGNAAIAAQLIGHATAVARQVGVDFICVDSSRQTGNTFGERLSGALQQAFASGYAQLLVIGNDCPQLDAARLRRALAALARTGAVLGPATDGGVYLLGVARAHFEARAWAALPWQTATLGRALARQLRTSGAAVGWLPELADIDNEQDLAHALRQALPWALRRALRRLRRGPAAAAPKNPAPADRPGAAPAQPRRGPPAY